MLPVCFLALSLLCSADDAEIKSLVVHLASVEQTERDVAAKRLREVFEPSQRKTWEPLLDSLKPGSTKKELLDKLHPAQRQVEAGIGSGGSHMEEYRLDHFWLLRCWFLNEGDVLREANLESRMQHVWAAPPADFSGVWVTYFVNGQPSHVIEYHGGSYHGTFTANHADGSKAYVQHYGPEGADGEDTGYYPSGKVSYRAFYSKGKAIGIWTWYNIHGEVTNTRVH